jgi:drug/metabolite transporter (DMT)-like permease
MKQEAALDVLLRLASRWWMAFAASAVFVVSGHLLIKAGLNSLVPASAGDPLATRVLHIILQPGVIGGLFIYAVGTVCWMRTVSQKEISFVYPLSSVNYVLVVMASTAFFQEVISARRAAGVVTIVLGMILMTRQAGENES